MRTQLNSMSISGKVVIGEGEMDEAPMLYIGETLANLINQKLILLLILWMEQNWQQIINQMPFQ